MSEEKSPSGGAPLPSDATAPATATDPTGPTDPADPDAPDFFWTVPEEFRSLGLEYTDEEREEHLVHLADAIWPGGTDEEQERIIAWYRDVAQAAAADGAVYAGVCMLGTEDDRVSTASLTVRCEPIEGNDADLAARGLVEALSVDEYQEVHRVEAAWGPAVLVISGFEMTPAGEQDGAVPSSPADPAPSPVVFARADVYCPLTAVSQLLVLSLTTPSLKDLPWYVHRLSEITDTIEIPSRPLPSPVTASSGSVVPPSAGPTGGGPGASPISSFIL
ncbi:hypothetical protein [Streptomyces macrosporus]|uniref:Uncharacterized protein n=1 Tax=Streptomyces macrosporus TaxID=44032 RepID=A0ABP5XKA9_9ACTN